VLRVSQNSSRTSEEFQFLAGKLCGKRVHRNGSVLIWDTTPETDPEVVAGEFGGTGSKSAHLRRKVLRHVEDLHEVVHFPVEARFGILSLERVPWCHIFSR
jgi:hypothetical protein